MDRRNLQRTQLALKAWKSSTQQTKKTMDNHPSLSTSSSNEQQQKKKVQRTHPPKEHFSSTLPPPSASPTKRKNSKRGESQSQKREYDTKKEHFSSILQSPSSIPPYTLNPAQPSPNKRAKTCTTSPPTVKNDADGTNNKCDKYEAAVLLGSLASSPVRKQHPASPPQPSERLFHDTSQYTTHNYNYDSPYKTIPSPNKTPTSKTPKTKKTPKNPTPKRRTSKTPIPFVSNTTATYEKTLFDIDNYELGTVSFLEFLSQKSSAVENWSSHDTLSLIHSLRVKTCLPPVDSPLHDVIQKVIYPQPFIFH